MMITMKEWMELINYEITEGSNYGWDCYGPSSYSLDSWNGKQDGYSFSIVFDTKTQEVYEVQVHDYLNNRAYRMFNPDTKLEHDAEAEDRNVDDMAWDDTAYIDLEVDDDFFQKALAIRAGEHYDTRVQMEIEMSDEDALAYMKAAHEMDLTFNEFVEQALRHAIDTNSLKPPVHGNW